MTEEYKPETTNTRPQQEELPFDSTQVERITPKRTIEQNEGIMKAKALFTKFFRKKTPIEPDSPVDNSYSENRLNEDNVSVAAEKNAMNLTKTGTSWWKHPENWVILQKLPLKYRRIFIVLLLFVLILLVFMWLRPDPKVQHYFEQSGDMVPTQFQPLKPIEETQPPGQDAQIPSSQEQQTQQPFQENLAEVKETATAETQTLSAETQDILKQFESESEHRLANVSENSSTAQGEAAREANRPLQSVQDVQVPVVRDEQKAEVLKPSSNTKKVKKTEKVKVLTIPKGTSLMQVFRNHGLNIADVNAMTKAKNAGNALGRFKPGDQVKIKLNSSGRVAELSLPQGGRFIRQTDGSYVFKK